MYAPLPTWTQWLSKEGTERDLLHGTIPRISGLPLYGNDLLARSRENERAARVPRQESLRVGGALTETLAPLQESVCIVDGQKDQQQQQQEQRSGEGSNSALSRLRQHEKAKAETAPKDEKPN